MDSKLKSMHPAWFASALTSAGIALMLLFDPLPFTNLDSALGTVLTVVTFAILLVTIPLMAVRFIRFRADFIADFQHPNFGPLFAAAPAAILVGSIAIGQMMIQEKLSRGIFEPITLGLIVIGAAGTLTLGLLFFTNILNSSELPIVAMNGSWFIPVVPLILIPNALIRLVADNQADSALETWSLYAFISLLALGAGLFLFGLLAAIVGYRLLTQPAPPAHAVATWWIWLAPLGVGGLGIIATGSLLTTAVSDLTYFHLAKALATGFWGFGIWWLLLASVMVLKVRKQIHFHLGLWGFGFPSAALTTLTLQISEQYWQLSLLDNLAAVFAIATTLLYFWLVWLTIRSVQTGKAFIRG